MKAGILAFAVALLLCLLAQGASARRVDRGREARRGQSKAATAELSRKELEKLGQQLSQIQSTIKRVTGYSSVVAAQVALGPKFLEKQPRLRGLAISFTAMGVEQAVAQTLAVQFYKLYLPRAQWPAAREYLSKLAAQEGGAQLVQWAERVAQAVTGAIVAQPLIDAALAALQRNGMAGGPVQRFTVAYLVSSAVTDTVERYLLGKNGLLRAQAQKYLGDKMAAAGPPPLRVEPAL